MNLAKKLGEEKLAMKRERNASHAFMSW